MKIGALVVLTLLIVGCGPTWVIVKQSRSNPMLGQRNFTVEPLSYQGLMVGDKTEDEYLDGKSEATISGFEVDKSESIDFFEARLKIGLKRIGVRTARGPGPGVFVIRPHVTDYEPGSFNGFFNLPTTVKMRVRFLAPQGKLLDEVDFSGVIAADLYHPSSGQRMRDALANLGAQIGAYLKTRIAPDQDED